MNHGLEGFFYLERLLGIRRHLDAASEGYRCRELVKSLGLQPGLVLRDSEVFAIHSDLRILGQEVLEGTVKGALRVGGIDARDAVLDKLSEGDDDGAAGVGRHG